MTGGESKPADEAGANATADEPVADAETTAAESAAVETAPPPLPETSAVDEAQTPDDEDSGDADRREMSRMTRRSLITGAVAAGMSFGAWHWLRTRTREGGLEWPLRRVLESNERLAMAYFRGDRLSPQFLPSQITAARINGGLGLHAGEDDSAWRLRIEGVAGSAAPIELDLDAVRAFGRREMITELRCIEGWSIIVRWAGMRLADVMRRYPPPAGTRYVAMETPDRGYYVGLDMQSAMHPQTLLAYEMDGRPLTWQHGAPLRLAIPVKYGVKNIKRIGTIRYTAIRPADYWAERGYDWYAGH